MRTIESIIAVASILEPVFGQTISINGFDLRLAKVPRSYSNHYTFVVHFWLECNEYHIQPLVEMGLQMHFKKKTKSSGSNDNTLRIPAVCSIEMLNRLNEYARHNHITQLSLCNKVQLSHCFPFKQKFLLMEEKSEHQKRIEALRKKARRIKSEKRISPAGYGFNK